MNPKETQHPRDDFEDIDVVPVYMLDEAHRGQFKAPWLVVHADGAIDEYAHEDDACAAQRAQRVAHGRNPLTGEAMR